MFSPIETGRRFGWLCRDSQFHRCSRHCEFNTNLKRIRNELDPSHTISSCLRLTGIHFFISAKSVVFRIGRSRIPSQPLLLQALATFKKEVAERFHFIRLVASSKRNCPIKFRKSHATLKASLFFIIKRGRFAVRRAFILRKVEYFSWLCVRPILVKARSCSELDIL